jgi:hypothetical protein
MTDTQLELSFGGPRVTQPLRPGRASSPFTSRWWFHQMHQIVDRAFDWQPAPPARPEQSWLPGTHRPVSLNS